MPGLRALACRDPRTVNEETCDVVVDRVAMMAMNSDRYLEYYCAVWWAGAVVNPVNIRWSPAEVAHSLDDCETAVLVVDDAFKGAVDELRRRSKALRTVPLRQRRRARGLPVAGRADRRRRPDRRRDARGR